MESINEKMDTQLRTRVDELTRANDENQDGRLDAADLKAQLTASRPSLSCRISRTAASLQTSTSG